MSKIHNPSANSQFLMACSRILHPNCGISYQRLSKMHLLSVVLRCKRLMTTLYACLLYQGFPFILCMYSVFSLLSLFFLSVISLMYSGCFFICQIESELNISQGNHYTSCQQRTCFYLLSSCRRCLNPL